MNKQQALDMIEEHLDMLATYGVLSDEIAATLYNNLWKIVMSIDEGDPVKDQIEKDIQNITEMWKSMKNKHNPEI
jgi:chemotaxis regulatin CheY-phosphate phosphatase CheZ